MEFTPQIDTARAFLLASSATSFRFQAASKTLQRTASLLKYSQNHGTASDFLTARLIFALRMLGLLVNFQTKITHLSVVFLRWQLGMTFTRSVFLIVQHTVCLLRTCALEHRKHSSGLTITKLRQLVQSRSYLDKLQHTQVLFFPTHCSHICYDLNFQQQSKPGFKILLLAHV